MGHTADCVFICLDVVFNLGILVTTYWSDAVAKYRVVRIVLYDLASFIVRVMISEDVFLERIDVVRFFEMDDSVFLRGSLRCDRDAERECD